MSVPTNGATAGADATEPRLLYCHCAYAKVVPEDVKAGVLRRMSDAQVAFDAVPDLCEMAARKDPALKRMAADGNLRIAACFPRAVRWLFHGAGADLPETGVDIHNMRERTAIEVADAMLGLAMYEVADPEEEVASEGAGVADEGDPDQ